MNKTNIGRQISNAGYHGRICLLTFAVENQCRMKHNDVLDIKTVCECNRCLGCETLHPQATLIRLNGKETVVEESVKFEFYAILLIENCVDNCRCCGRRYYDFAHATMVFLTPGEIFCMNRDNTLPDCGLLLAFHPDLLWRTALNRHINDYTFFRYRKEEALHLSQRETERVLRYFNDIGEELHHAIDSHSSILISRLIELLLDYCTRFYERQFITREDKNKELLSRLERRLDDYIASGRLAGGRFPTAAECAATLDLSEAYFCDLLRFETGRTLTELLHVKRLEAAKRMLLTPGTTPAQVARHLGFANVMQFSFIFKKLTGVAPAGYRFARN